MKVEDLVRILKAHDPEAEIIIAQSDSDWDEVLIIRDDPSFPDTVTEIRVD